MAATNSGTALDQFLGSHVAKTLNLARPITKAEIFEKAA